MARYVASRFASVIAKYPKANVVGIGYYKTCPSRHLCIGSASSSEGQINNELIERMQTKIQNALQAQSVQVADMQGDGRHVEILVVAESFEGLNAVNRQRMVYKAIWEELQDTVHAVDAMVTRTPKEAGL